MTVADPDQGITLNVGADPANLPSQQNAEFGGLLVRLNRLYASEAARTANRTATIENGISSLADVDRVEVWNGVNDISLHSRALWANVRRAADSAAVNNSVVLVNDTNLLAPLPTAGIFQWRQTSFYDCTAVADFKLGYTWPAGATAIWGITGLSPAAAANPGDGTFPTVATSGGTTSVGGTGAGTILMFTVEGEITMGGTAGNLQFQYAQQNAEVSNLIHRARSRLHMWRVT